MTIEGEAPVRTNYPMLKIDITNMTYEEYLHGYHQSNLMKYQEMLAMKQMELMALNNPMAMMGMMGGGMHPPPNQQHPGGGGRGGHFRGRRY